MRTLPGHGDEEMGSLPCGQAGVVMTFTLRDTVLSCGWWDYSSFIYSR